MIYATNIELGHGENGTRMEDDGGLFPGILGTPVPLPTKHHRFEHVRGIPRPCATTVRNFRRRHGSF